MVKQVWLAAGCAFLAAGAVLLETSHNAALAWSLIVCGAAVVVTALTADSGRTRD
jgi:hypothetical protein